MGKELKTNAMRFLDTKKIAYEVQAYQCDEFIDGVHVCLLYTSDAADE